MEKENSNRTRRVIFRLTPEEYSLIDKRWRTSTNAKLSDYIRHILFEKPVVVSYRNSSADEFISELGRLRGELNAIGNNFNQVTKRLHTIRDIAEFKGWLVRYEIEKKTLFNKIDEIKTHVQKASESWLR